MSTEEKIETPLLVAGFLKELTLYSQEVVAQIGDTQFPVEVIEVKDYSNQKTNVQENSVRYRFRTPFVPSLDAGAEIRFECDFTRFKAVWISKVVGIEGGTDLVATQPTSIATTTNRKSRRADFPEEFRKRVKILLRNGALFSQGYLNVKDISKQGLGGALWVDKSFPMGTGVEIIGSLVAKIGSYRLNGVVTWVARGEVVEQRKDSLVKYDIGVNSGAREGAIRGERIAKRTPAEFSMSVLSPLSRDSTISVEVLDASVSGFKGRVKHRADDVFFPLGLSVVAPEYGVGGLVTRADSESFSVHFNTGDETAQRRWLNRIGAHSAKSPVVDGREIIRLFCESGALSSGYLKEQQQLVDEMLIEIRNTITDDHWNHRSILRNSLGRLVSHVNSVRIGDNCWYIGDIAGVKDGDAVSPQVFISNYLCQMNELGKHIEPAPNSIIMWKEGHKFWSEFEGALNSSLKEQVIGSWTLGYQRFTEKEFLASEETGAQIKRITSRDHIAVTEKIEQLKKLGLDQLLFQLGFSIDSFGSPLLKKIVGLSGEAFERYFFDVSIGGSKWIFVVSRFPGAATVLKSEQAIWAFQYQDSKSEKVSLKQIFFEAQKISLELGLKAPGIVYSPIDADLAQNKSILFLLRSGAFRFWETS